MLVIMQYVVLVGDCTHIERLFGARTRRPIRRVEKKNPVRDFSFINKYIKFNFIKN